MSDLWRKIHPPFWEREGSEIDLLNYRRLWKTTFWSILAVALIPLFFLAAVNFYQFDQQNKLQREQITTQIQQLLATKEVQISYFLEERQAALTFVTLENAFDDLTGEGRIGTIFRRLKPRLPGRVERIVISISATN